MTQESFPQDALTDWAAEPGAQARQGRATVGCDGPSPFSGRTLRNLARVASGRQPRFGAPPGFKR